MPGKTGPFDIYSLGADGTAYLADTENHALRAVDLLDGTVRTLVDAHAASPQRFYRVRAK